MHRHVLRPAEGCDRIISTYRPPQPERRNPWKRPVDSTSEASVAFFFGVAFDSLTAKQLQKANKGNNKLKEING